MPYATRCPRRGLQHGASARGRRPPRRPSVAGPFGEVGPAPGRADQAGRPAVEGGRGRSRRGGEVRAQVGGAVADRRSARVRHVGGTGGDELGGGARPGTQRGRRGAAGTVRRGRGPDDVPRRAALAPPVPPAASWSPHPPPVSWGP